MTVADMVKELLTLDQNKEVLVYIGNNAQVPAFIFDCDHAVVIDS